MPTRVSATNSIFGSDTFGAIDEQYRLGIRDLDLKDALFGTTVSSITLEQAHQIKDEAKSKGMDIYCLSTTFFDHEADKGEAHFRQEILERLPHVLDIAEILQPTWIRLMAAQTFARPADAGLGEHLDAAQPWLIPLYREAIDRITKAGFAAIIENEVGNSILRNADDVDALFDRLAGSGRVALTWDVQNMWESGAFPTGELYERLKPHIGYVHVKGGRLEPGETRLRKSTLRDASWPVAEIVSRVSADGVSPVICINPSHGETPAGYDPLAAARDDVAYVRELVGGVSTT